MRNKINLYLVVAFLLQSSVVIAQSGSLNTTELTSKEYSRLLNQQFASILTGQSNNSLGSFASIDIEDSKVEFAPSIFFYNGNILSLEIEAGISDGVTSIFSNSTLNSNFSAKVNYHFLRKNDDFLDIKNLKNIQDLISKLDKKKNKEVTEIRKGKKLNSLKQDIDKLKREIRGNKNLIDNENFSKNRVENYKLKKKVITHEIDALYKELSILSSEKDQSKITKINRDISQKKLDLIEIDNKIFKENQSSGRIADLLEKNLKAQKKIDSIKEEIKAYNSNFEEFKTKESFRKQRAELVKKYEVTGLKLKWFSLSYEVNSNSFKQINLANAFADQINNESFTGHRFGFQFSWLKMSSSKASESFFWSSGLKFSIDDNFNDLTKIEITETTQLGPTSGERSRTRKFNAYSGDYINHRRSLEFYTDFYYFLFHKNRAAIHVYPNYVAAESAKPRVNLGVGLLYTFKNKDADSSIVNAELYYNFLDVFKTTETDYKLFERNDIGLRFTFPINFNL